MRTPLVFPFATLLVACSALNSPPPLGQGGSGASGSTGTDGLGGELDPTGSSSTGPGGGEGCTEASQLVYVLSDANELYRFRPLDRVFEKIGALGCPTSMLPNSMAVDRGAVAWVNYVDTSPLGEDSAGALFRVDTKDASCEGPVVQLGPSWYRLGMGFSSDEAGGVGESLFVTGTGTFDSPGLGRVDTTTGALTPLGSFTGSLSGQNAELTGTGDARLFGFFTTTPVEVAEIDKATSAILSSAKLGAVETPSAWAFSFWGGDFYLYTAPDPFLDPSRTSNVTRYRPSDGSVDTGYMVNVGFRIVGAGVSTCAPVEEPK
jgi:hypothetical protein